MHLLLTRLNCLSFPQIEGVSKSNSKVFISFSLDISFTKYTEFNTYLSRKSLSTIAVMSRRGFPIPKRVFSLKKRQTKYKHKLEILLKVS